MESLRLNEFPLAARPLIMIPKRVGNHILKGE